MTVRAWSERWKEIASASTADGSVAPGPAIWVGKREVAHFDADGCLDVRIIRQFIRVRRGELGADERVSFRAGSSDWLEINLDHDSDIEFAVSLITDAVAAKLPTANRVRH